MLESPLDKASRGPLIFGPSFCPHLPQSGICLQHRSLLPPAPGRPRVVVGVRELSDPAGPAAGALRASQPHVCGFTKHSQANQFPHLHMKLAARSEGIEVETSHSPVDRGQGLSQPLHPKADSSLKFPRTPCNSKATVPLTKCWKRVLFSTKREIEVFAVKEKDVESAT